jgi:hypothetical protein
VAVSDSHLPCYAHATPMPCSDHTVLLKATAQHGHRETACGLPTRFRLLLATTRSSTKTVIRSIPILLTTIHTYDIESGSSTLQKRRSVKILGQQFGYFRLPRGLSRRTRHCRSIAEARHGVCELTARHGRGTSWARHGHSMLCVNRPVNLFTTSAVIFGERHVSEQHI